VDYASFSAHKVGGPVGVGVLWRRSGAPLDPLHTGGGQEAGLRAGTEDVAGIAAAAVAIEHAVREQPEYARRTGALARELWSDLVHAMPTLALVGPPLDEGEIERGHRLPNTLCIRCPETDGKVLVTRLDLLGIEASAGSACASGSVEPSHVLRAMGYDDDAARSGLRLTLGRDTSRTACKQVVDLIHQLVLSSHAT
jgi:cysteine desulfurase